MSIGEAVSGVFTHMLHAIDLRDWQAVRDAFADHVDIDYSSLFGAPAATVSSDEHVGGWRSFGGAFDATQHLTGPFVTSEREGAVLATTSVRAYHRIAGDAGRRHLDGRRPLPRAVRAPPRRLADHRHHAEGASTRTATWSCPKIAQGSRRSRRRRSTRSP